MRATCDTIIESPLTALTHIATSLDALNCGAMLVSRGGVIAHVNPRLCQWTERPLESLVGSDLVSMYGQGEACQAVRTMLGSFDESREAEFFVPQPNGHRLPVIFSARPVGTSPLLAEYAVVTLIDISRQKRAEQQLIEQNAHVNNLSDRVIEQSLAIRQHSEDLEQKVIERTAQLHDAHMETIYMLAIASEAKDQDTGDHVRRLRRMSQLLAERMGVEAREAEEIGHSAVLHDVGKIHTPDSILKKPAPLTIEERKEIQQHTLAGERILKPSPYFTQASRIARSHHENWDGSGYPDKLVGNQIPFEARIVHLVDVFDALIHPRVYKPAWSRADALAEIVHQRGKMFDPDVTDAFVKLEQDGEIERVQAAVANSVSRYAPVG
jgi:HD-GYP domain-containing protein (c-di-GMP phosphodiesterase class II)